jgi:hypothetical protein
MSRELRLRGLVAQVAPHDGYLEGEVPVYGPCPDCGESLRLDRTDLIPRARRALPARRLAQELALSFQASGVA